MISEACFRVFVDADVVAAPLTRTVLILAGTHPGEAFVPRWSLTVEPEANRHLRPGQALIDQVRERCERGSEVIVPAVPPAPVAPPMAIGPGLTGLDTGVRQPA
ncbi:MAG: hypothetical protein LBJ08_05500 [Bifidobacteriaceae bacterium]|nr:hypothetical protein [Bifidobacteriaceae bacterium]